jgi:hypothetical protein
MHKGSLFLNVFTPPPNLGGGWEGVDLTPTLSLMRRGGFNPTLTLPLLRGGNNRDQNMSNKQGVYVITDSALLQGRLVASVEAALQGGAQLVQYRDKSTDSAQTF